MNQTIEKWLTIGALVGWVASIGSLVGLAVRAASPAVALRPVQVSSLHLASRNDLEIHTQAKPTALDSLAIQRRIATIAIPMDTSKGYWVDSLRERSSSSAKWMSQRSH